MALGQPSPSPAWWFTIIWAIVRFRPTTAPPTRRAERQRVHSQRVSTTPIFTDGSGRRVAVVQWTARAFCLAVPWSPVAVVFTLTTHVPLPGLDRILSPRTGSDVESDDHRRHGLGRDAASSPDCPRAGTDRVRHPRGGRLADRQPPSRLPATAKNAQGRVAVRASGNPGRPSPPRPSQRRPTSHSADPNPPGSGEDGHPREPARGREGDELLGQGDAPGDEDRQPEGRGGADEAQASTVPRRSPSARRSSRSTPMSGSGRRKDPRAHWLVLAIVLVSCLVLLVIAGLTSGQVGEAADAPASRPGTDASPSRDHPGWSDRRSVPGAAARSARSRQARGAHLRRRPHEVDGEDPRRAGGTRGEGDLLRHRCSGLRAARPGQTHPQGGPRDRRAHLHPREHGQRPALATAHGARPDGAGHRWRERFHHPAVATAVLLGGGRARTVRLASGAACGQLPCGVHRPRHPRLDEARSEPDPRCGSPAGGRRRRRDAARRWWRSLADRDCSCRARR